MSDIFADLNVPIYHLLFVEMNEAFTKSAAEVKLRLTGECDSFRIRTTYFVWEDGAWRYPCKRSPSRRPHRD